METGYGVKSFLAQQKLRKIKFLLKLQDMCLIAKQCQFKYFKYHIFYERFLKTFFSQL